MVYQPLVLVILCNIDRSPTAHRVASAGRHNGLHRVPAGGHMDLPPRPFWLDGAAMSRAALRTWVPWLVLMLVWSAGAIAWTAVSVDSEAAGRATSATMRFGADRVSLSVSTEGLEGDATALLPTDLRYSSRELPSGVGADGAERADALEDELSGHATLLGWSTALALIIGLAALDRIAGGPLAHRAPRLAEICLSVLAGLLFLLLLLAVIDQGSIGATAGHWAGADESARLPYGDAGCSDTGGVRTCLSWAATSALWLELAALMATAVVFLLHTVEAVDPRWFGDAGGIGPRGLFGRGEPVPLGTAERLSSAAGDRLAALPVASLVLALGLLLPAFFVPWSAVSLAQPVQRETEGPWIASESTWTLGLFTGRSEITDVWSAGPTAETNTSSGGVGELAGFSQTSEQLKERRVPLFVAGALLLLPVGLALLPGRWTAALGARRLWWAVSALSAGLVLSTSASQFAVGTAVSLPAEAMAAATALGPLVPMTDVVGAEGHTLLVSSAGGGLAPFASLSWTHGPAVALVQLAASAAVMSGSLLLTGVHDLAGRAGEQGRGLHARLHGRRPAGDPWLERSSVSAAVPASGLIIILFIVLIGGQAATGLFTAQVTSQAAALKAWHVATTDDHEHLFRDSDLQDADQLMLVIEVPGQLANASQLSFNAGCSDNTGEFGDANPVGEDTDTFDVLIDVPESVGEDVIELDHPCQDAWSFNAEFGQYVHNDPDSPIRVEAPTAHLAGEAAADHRYDGTWTFTLTMHTKGDLGGTGLNPDTDMYAAMSIDGDGHVGTVSEIVDEGDE